MRGPHRSYFCDFSFQYQYRGPHRKQTISFIVAINFFFSFCFVDCNFTGDRKITK